MVNIQDENEELTSDFDALAQNTAKNICCKAKVDNSAINSYDVIDNNIVCLESGGKELSC